jgi:HK97 family phage major capsid protein
MQTLKQLQERRGSLLKSADAIVRATIAEKRDANSAESEELGSIKNDIFRTDQDIARIQRDFQMETIQSESRNHGGMNIEGYSLTRAIRQASAGRLDGLELEVSRELEIRSGIAPNGFLIPSNLLAERRAMGVTNDSGIYGAKTVATEKMGFVDALRPLLACAQAGALVLDGLSSDLDLPRQVAASTASWQTETSDLSEVTPEVAMLELRPRRVGAYTIFSKRLLAQASVDIENLVRNDLLQACAQALDKAALNGGSTNEPTGILATAGIGNIIGGTNGAAPTWAHIVALVAAIEGANALGSKMAFVINSATAAKLRSTPKITGTDSRFILEGNELLGHPVIVSNLVPSNLTKGTASGICSAIIFGAFDHLVLGSFGNALDLVVDPVTRAVQGQSRIIINSYVDAGVRLPGAFAAMKDALTA